jgi:nicotinamide mononucleotide transporter
VLDWFIKNHFEIICAITSLIYLYFSVKQNIWLWPLGIISSVYSVLVFYHSQLYADMSLNVYYIIVSFYGWFYWWTRKDNTAHDSIKIFTLSFANWVEYLSVALVLSLSFAGILIHIPQKLGLTPSSIPWMDASLTAGSAVATWMLARKVLEQWLWWVVIDAISVGVLIYKNLYIMAGLFVVYTIMAVVGYIKWRNDWKKQWVAE